MEKQFDAAFDWDGTLTSEDGPIGQDHGAVLDLQPLRLVLAGGFTAAVMTCNVVSYVETILRQNGIPAMADTTMQFKTYPDDLGPGFVIVTNRKVLARFYFDDRGREYHYGMDPRIPVLLLKGQPAAAVASRYTGDKNVSVTDPSTWAPWR
jgi:hypothetical protein